MVIVSVDFPGFHVSKDLSGEDIQTGRMSRLLDGVGGYNNSSEATEEIKH